MSHKGWVIGDVIYFSRPLLNTDINDPLNLTIETAQQLSPMDPSNFKTIYSNTRRTARFIIIHAENDSPAFHEQSRHFYELLKQTGCNTVLIEIENTDHFGKNTLDQYFLHFSLSAILVLTPASLTMHRALSIKLFKILSRRQLILHSN